MALKISPLKLFLIILVSLILFSLIGAIFYGVNTFISLYSDLICIGLAIALLILDFKISHSRRERTMGFVLVFATLCNFAMDIFHIISHR
jgi:hypothetical protein